MGLRSCSRAATLIARFDSPFSEGGITSKQVRRWVSGGMYVEHAGELENRVAVVGKVVTERRIEPSFLETGLTSALRTESSEMPALVG
jgi:hypothetical protein